MSIIGWLAFGLLAALIANKLVDGQRGGIFLDLTLGAIGAVAGGVMFTVFGDTGVASFNVFSMLVAVIGAVVVLLTYHALFVYRGNFND